MKKSFILYQDYEQHIALLTDEQAGKLLKAIFLFNKGRDPDLDPVVQMAFSFIKSNLERDNEKYKSIIERNKNNGLKGGRPKISETQRNPNNPVGFLETQNNPEEPKKPDNDTDTDTGIDTDTDIEKVKKKKSKKEIIGTRLPDYFAVGPDENEEWEMPDAYIDFCKSLGWSSSEIFNEALVFRDYWMATPGAKGRKTDWLATWRNWMRRADGQKKQAAARQAAFLERTKPFERNYK